MKILTFWKPVLWLAIICYGLFIPANELPTNPFFNIPHFDKIVHFLLFFGLNILLMRPLKKLNLKYYLLAPVISVFFGLILEYEQHIVTVSRNSDIYDFFANLSGIVAATLFYYFFVSEKKWELLF
jgi:VanZ family protein